MITKGGLGERSTAPVAFKTQMVKFDGTDMNIATGLYLLQGGAGSGKSVLARGIAASAVASGWEDVGVIYHFEPNAPNYASGEEGMFLDAARYLNTNQMSATGGTSKFYGDLGTYLQQWQATRDAEAKPAMLVLDSIAQQIRGYLIGARKNMPAGEKGLQSADIAFIERMNNTAVGLSLTIIGTINDDLVPFAAKLEGLVQGVITAETESRCTIKDRPNGRVPQPVRIGAEQVKEALENMGYDASKKKESPQTIGYQTS